MNVYKFSFAKQSLIAVTDSEGNVQTDENGKPKTVRGSRFPTQQATVVAIDDFAARAILESHFAPGEMAELDVETAEVIATGVLVVPVASEAPALDLTALSPAVALSQTPGTPTPVPADDEPEGEPQD
jgi:hypothetical protein